MSVILTSSDVGYDAIRANWVNNNYPVRFNYQLYFWSAFRNEAEELCFLQETPLPVVGNTVHNTDRPPVQGVSGPTARDI